MHQADIASGGPWHDRLYGLDSTQARLLLKPPAGRPRKGAADFQLAASLKRDLPYGLDELREAIAAGKHRSPAQKTAIDALGVFIAVRNPNLRSLAELLDGCTARTLNSYRKRGRKLLAQLERIEKLERIETKLDVILDALGLNPVTEAETILAIEVADDQGHVA